MNNQIVYNLYYAFAERGFSVLRFNFRGVGRSQGAFDHGAGELSDAAAALDWAQSINPEARACWIAGVSFGSWIGMQLLMRRPEIEGFISIAPPASRFDFSFLGPSARRPACSSTATRTASRRSSEVTPLIEKLKTQKAASDRTCGRQGANHFFENRIEPLIDGSISARTLSSRTRGWARSAALDVAGGRVACGTVRSTSCTRGARPGPGSRPDRAGPCGEAGHEASQCARVGRRSRAGHSNAPAATAAEGATRCRRRDPDARHDVGIADRCGLLNRRAGAHARQADRVRVRDPALHATTAARRAAPPRLGRTE